jgi:hypothetical protein
VATIICKEEIHRFNMLSMKVIIMSFVKKVHKGSRGTPGLQGLNGVKGMKNKFIMSVDILYLQLKTTPGVPT